MLSAARRRAGGGRRGYDSAGFATLNGSGLELHRAVGKIAALPSHLRHGIAGGSLGIAHTRWATHGSPSVLNAHPHVDCEHRVAIVQGHRFRSDTDSEVVAHLIEEHRNVAHAPGAEARRCNRCSSLCLCSCSRTTLRRCAAATSINPATWRRA